MVLGEIDAAKDVLRGVLASKEKIHRQGCIRRAYGYHWGGLSVSGPGTYMAVDQKKVPKKSYS